MENLKKFLGGGGMVNLVNLSNLNFEALSLEEIKELERKLTLEYHSHLDEKSRKFPPYWIENLIEKVEKALKEKKLKEKKK